MGDILESGYSVKLTKGIDGNVYPIYPLTRTTNVKDSNGKNVDEKISDLRNSIMEKVGDASTVNKGIVILSDNLEDDSLERAATIHSVSEVNTKVEELNILATSTTQKLGNRMDELDTEMDNTIKKSDLGISIPSLDENGFIPLDQIPASLDDVRDIEMDTDAGIAYVPKTDKAVEITPESGILYIDTESRQQYVWSGNMYAQTGAGTGNLVLGNTSGSAFRGDLGNTAYQHALSQHAPVNASVVTDSETNGNILVDGVELNVYIHPTGTNPHGLLKSDIGLGNVENKDSATIRSEISSSDINSALGFTPAKSGSLSSLQSSYNEHVELKSSGTVLGHVKLSNAATITTTGDTAMDAVQLNPNISGTLANLLSSLTKTVSDNYTTLTNKFASYATTTAFNNHTGTNASATTRGHVYLSNETSVDTAGSYALDAVQLNPNIADSLAAKISTLRTNLGNNYIATSGNRPMLGDLRFNGNQQSLTINLPTQADGGKITFDDEYASTKASIQFPRGMTGDGIYLNGKTRVVAEGFQVDGDTSLLGKCDVSGNLSSSGTVSGNSIFGNSISSYGAINSQGLLTSTSNIYAGYTGLGGTISIGKRIRNILYYLRQEFTSTSYARIGVYDNSTSTYKNYIDFPYNGSTISTGGALLVGNNIMSNDSICAGYDGTGGSLYIKQTVSSVEHYFRMTHADSTHYGRIGMWDQTNAKWIHFIEMNYDNSYIASSSPVCYNNNEGMQTVTTGGVRMNLLYVNSSNHVHVSQASATEISGLYMHIAANQYEFVGNRFSPAKADSNTMTLGASGKLWSTVYAKTTTISTSDRTKKNHIEDISDVYEKLFLSIKPKTFYFNDGDRIHIGAISQDVEEAMGELNIKDTEFAGFCKDIRMKDVIDENGDPSGEEPDLDENGDVQYDYALRYSEFIMLNTHMIQKTIAKVDALEKENSELKDKVSSMEERLAKLEALLSS